MNTTSFALPSFPPSRKRAVIFLAIAVAGLLAGILFSSISAKGGEGYSATEDTAGRGDLLTGSAVQAQDAGASDVHVEGADDIVKLTSIVNYQDDTQDIAGAKMNIIVFRKSGR